jgi:hypothetical protein
VEAEGAEMGADVAGAHGRGVARVAARVTSMDRRRRSAVRCCYQGGVRWNKCRRLPCRVWQFS